VGRFFSELWFFGFFFSTAGKEPSYIHYRILREKINAVLHLKPLDQLTYSWHTLGHA